MDTTGGTKIHPNFNFCLLHFCQLPQFFNARLKFHCVFQWCWLNWCQRGLILAFSRNFRDFHNLPHPPLSSCWNPVRHLYFWLHFSRGKGSLMNSSGLFVTKKPKPKSKPWTRNHNHDLVILATAKMHIFPPKKHKQFLLPRTVFFNYAKIFQVKIFFSFWTSILISLLYFPTFLLMDINFPTPGIWRQHKDELWNQCFVFVNCF